MPPSYPGRKNKGIPPDYFETRVQFADIYNHPKLKLIERSPSQRVIDEDKVESMIDEYIKRPHFFRFKNHIVICDLRNKWYLVDGQHRIEMARRGYEEYNLNDEFIFCWYSCTNENDMRELFNSVNKDSIGNEFYVNQDNLSDTWTSLTTSQDYWDSLYGINPLSGDPDTGNIVRLERHTEKLQDQMDDMMKQDEEIIEQHQKLFEALADENGSAGSSYNYGN